MSVETLVAPLLLPVLLNAVIVVGDLLARSIPPNVFFFRLLLRVGQKFHPLVVKRIWL
jgi:hypothetical protein